MKKFTKTTSCLYIFLMYIEHKKINKEEIKTKLDISDLDFYRYKAEIKNMLFDFGRYDIIDEMELVKNENKNV